MAGPTISVLVTEIQALVVDIRELRTIVHELAKEIGSEARRAHERIDVVHSRITTIETKGCAHAPVELRGAADREMRLRVLEGCQQRRAGAYVVAAAGGGLVGTVLAFLGRILITSLSGSKT